MLELRQTILQALTASFEVSRRLHEAGNIADLDFARERALLEAGKLALRSVEVAVRQSREELNILMGLWGNQTSGKPKTFTGNTAAGDPDRGSRTGSAQPQRGSFDRPATSGVCGRTTRTEQEQQLCFPNRTSGALGERTDGAWEVGPVLEFPIPLFDQGQARTGRAAAELRGAQQEYYALAIQIVPCHGPSAIAWRERGIALYTIAISCSHFQERIVNEAQLQYNAMQLGPIQLLRAREQQIDTGAAYVEALRDYWLARRR